MRDRNLHFWVWDVGYVKNGEARKTDWALAVHIHAQQEMEIKIGSREERRREERSCVFPLSTTSHPHHYLHLRPKAQASTPPPNPATNAPPSPPFSFV